MNSYLPGSAEPLVVLAQLVVNGADPDRLTREVACATARDLEAGLCEILRPTPDGEEFSLVASSERRREREMPSVTGGVSSLAGYTLLCKAPVVSEDLEKERRFGRVGSPDWEGSVSAGAAPVPCRGDTFSVIVAYATQAEHFGSHQALAISRMASLLGGALERSDEYEELRRRAKGKKCWSVVAHETHEHDPERYDCKLTGRQLEVLRLLADGRPAKRIASDMGISIHTVHFHQRNLYRTLSVGSLTGAIKRARELGLL